MSTLVAPAEVRHTWNATAVRNLGLTTNVETAGAIRGIGRIKAYKPAKHDQFNLVVPGRWMRAA